MKNPKCGQGSCYDNIPYTCKCDVGYKGEFCNERINPDFCATTTEPLCLNGGECMSTPGAVIAYVCLCPDGYEGYNCGEAIVVSTQPLQTEPTTEENQVVLGVVIGVASILILIAIVISGLICCMRSRNRQFKHYEDDEAGQFCEAEEEFEPKIVRNVAPIQSRTSKLSPTKSKNHSTHALAAVDSCVGSDTTAAPPSYNEVIDSRRDMAVLH